MPKPKNNPVKQDERIVRINNSRENWSKFEVWMARQGCMSLAEGFRAAMNFIILNCNKDKQEGQEHFNQIITRTPIEKQDAQESSDSPGGIH